MKIAFLQDDFPPQSFGGAGFSVYELSQAMKKAGHEVFIITTCEKKEDAGEGEYNGLKIFKIQSNYSGKWRAYLSVYNPLAISEIKKIFKKINLDVVHANNIHYHLSFHSLKVAQKYAKIVVYTGRDTMPVCYGKLQTKRYLEDFNYKVSFFDEMLLAKKRWNPLRRFFIKNYLISIDKVFTVSVSLRNAFIKNGIINVEVAHTGIDVNDWQVGLEDVRKFKKKYSLENNRIILFSGRLGSGKGGAKTIEAMAKIAKEVPEAVLLVAGTVDDYANLMKDEARKLGIEKRLIFTGWISGDELKASYGASDIVLVPSLYLDPFPRIVLEAMASRKPVVGTCYGGTPEIVVDGVTGYIVNPLYPDKIAEKVVDLLKNPKKAEQFGNAGYERVKTHFNLEDKVKEYVAVYKSLMEDSK